MEARPHSAVRLPAPSDERDVTVAYPSLRRAAELVGVHPSTLSRRADLERIAAGRETRIPAREVVRLADVYRMRAVSRVSGELVELAGAHGPDVQSQIASEVDEALERIPPASPVSDVPAFLAAARRHLPPDMAAQVEAQLQGAAAAGASTVGWSPEDA